MRAFRVTGAGAPRLLDIPKPVPGAGEALVRIRACGLNFADLLMADGTYQDTPPLPFTLGLELAGEIEAVGQNVSPDRVGERVAVYAGQGGLADHGCFPAGRCTPMPGGMPFADAAAFQIAYGTSHVALDHKARLVPGETLLVLGAAGGVGLSAVEIGKRMGARVIACARGGARLRAAERAGADHLIDSAGEDIRDAVRALGGADVVYDPVGGAQFTAAFRACTPGARYLLIGFASGQLPELRPNHMLVKNISLIGVNWGGYLKFAPDVLTDSMARLFSWYRQGGLRPHIGHTLPLERAGEGLSLLRDRKATGKIVITP